MVSMTLLQEGSICSRENIEVRYGSLVLSHTSVREKKAFIKTEGERGRGLYVWLKNHPLPRVSTVGRIKS